ncbi:hypothetical protein BC938DRAFT_480719 [Jimgerdemannia flammicorona]|uniref:Glycerophosphocholine acyltransferase 1 n=1 Tax=Jimgerdemannia flammicorona TaxID=994334 RepID=A0A433QHV3_9FUNG|nr:hypothetical protein BC938DRAFT_480719 [Jimgerdemannia flammicorona]
MATDQDDSICEWESDDDGYTSNDLNFFDLIDHVSNALESVTGQIQKGQKELLYKSQEFKDKTTKAWHTQRAQLERRRAKLQTRLETLHTRFTSDQKVVRIRDKVSFVVGVGNACLSPWMAAKYPEWVPHWYTLQALYLIPLRFFIYKSRSWHYFVYDLCYFVNVLTVLWLYVFPSSQWLFISLFCLTHGPIAWAIIAWRNSFVFHSMDKVTSLFIHIFPPFALYTVRWLHPDIGARNAQYPALEELETLDFTRALQFSLAVYSVWQLLYYIFIVVGRRDKVEKGLRATSYSWLLNDPRNQGGLFSRVANTFGPKNKVYMFMLLQGLYAVLTIVPTVLYYRYFWLNTAFLVGMFVTSVWNGASYYIDVFSRQYTIELEKLQKERKEIKREIDDGTVVASGDEGLRNRVKMEN